MLKILFGGSIIAALIVSPVTAKTVVISGKYSYSSVQNCESHNSGLSETSGLLTFDPTAGTVTLSGNVIEGDPPAMKGVSATVSYSNTATTLTINGVVYQAVYGKVSKGKATYLTYIGVNSPDGFPCGTEGWMSLQ